MVEDQGQMFWVVMFQVRKGVSYQVKEWGLGRRRDLNLRIGQDRGRLVNRKRKVYFSQVFSEGVKVYLSRIWN